MGVHPHEAIRVSGKYGDVLIYPVQFIVLGCSAWAHCLDTLPWVVGRQNSMDQFPWLKIREVIIETLSLFGVKYLMLDNFRLSTHCCTFNSSNSPYLINILAYHGLRNVSTKSPDSNPRRLGVRYSYRKCGPWLVNYIFFILILKAVFSDICAVANSTKRVIKTTS